MRNPTFGYAHKIAIQLHKCYVRCRHNISINVFKALWESDDLLLVVKKNRNCVVATRLNNAAQQYVSQGFFPRKSLEKFPPFYRTSIKHPDGFIADIQDCLEKGTPFLKEIYLPGGINNLRWWQIHLIPVGWQEAVLILRSQDKTKSLAIEKRHLASQWQKFTSIIQHELQSFPRHLDQAMELFELKKLTVEELNVEIRAISEQARRTLDGLVRLSEASKELDLQIFNVVDLIESEVRKLSNHQNFLSQINATKNEFWVNADRDLVKICIDNLLSNSLKFRDSDRELSINWVIGNGGDFVKISLADNGIGLEESELGSIWRPLHRTNPDVPGQGIGLSAVAAIVDRHGGEYWASSEGIGSVFGFSMPKAVPCQTNNATD